jgi:ABC-type branched-subunit amino acid transport system ATPase component
VREDEIACRSLGINTTTTKLTAFAMGAMFGGFAGSFFAARQGFISPESFTFMESAVIVAIVVLGGMGSQIGVAIAAIIMIGGTELMRVDFQEHIRPRFDPPSTASVVRLCHGADHDLEAAWTDHRPRTFGIPARSKTAAGPLVREGRYSASVQLLTARDRARYSNRGYRAGPSVEHLGMRFGGASPSTIFRLRSARRGHALIGPNGAGKTTVFNCITGFYKPTEGRIALQLGDPAVWTELEALTDRGTRSVVRSDGALFLLERMPDYLVAREARVARTFQNIRLFQGMSVLKICRCTAQFFDAGIGFPILGPRVSLTKPARRSTRRATGSIIDSPAYRRSSRRVALGAQRGEIACHVREPALLCPTSRPRSRTGAGRSLFGCDPGPACNLGPADRARHVGGDGDFRPHCGAGPRPKDRGRYPTRNSQ